MNPLEREIRAEIYDALAVIGVKYWATSDGRASRNTPGTPDIIVSLGEGLRAAPSPRTLARSDVTAPVWETHERLLRGTLDVLDFNRRILGRLRALLFVGLLCLVAGMRLRPRFHCQPPPPFNVTPRRPCHP